MSARWCVILLVCVGCASAPERRAPELDLDMPARVTSAAPSSPVPADWWTDFADDGLAAIIADALAHNYDIRAAAARVDAAAASARLAGAEGLPNLSASGTASRRKQNIIGIPIPGSGAVITTRNNTFGVSLDTSWELDLWGRVRMGRSAAEADLEAAWADLAAARLSIAGQTAKAWFAFIEANQQRELAAETVESYRVSADHVQRRYDEGVRSSLDVRLARSALAVAEATLETRRLQAERAARGLEILLGRYPGATVTAPADLPAVTRPVPGGLSTELLIRRPDLFAAERRFAASEARVSAARRAFFPRLTLTGSAGTLTDDFERLADGDFSVWSVAAGITQPIFSGGRLRANLAASHAASDQALARYAGALLGAFADVELALVSERVLAERENHLREAAAQSRAARDLAQRQYNAGLVDYITVLETQRSTLSTESELISVRRERLDARANLYLALGGGFRLDESWTQFLDAPQTPRTEDPGE